MTAEKDAARDLSARLQEQVASLERTIKCAPLARFSTDSNLARYRASRTNVGPRGRHDRGGQGGSAESIRERTAAAPSGAVYGMVYVAWCMGRGGLQVHGGRQGEAGGGNQRADYAQGAGRSHARQPAAHRVSTGVPSQHQSPYGSQRVPIIVSRASQPGWLAIPDSETSAESRNLRTPTLAAQTRALWTAD